MADLQRALDFTADLAKVNTPADFAGIALSGLDALVPADLWGFNDLDPGSKEMIAFIWPEDGAEPAHFEAVAKVVWEHPVLQQFERTGNGTPVRLSDLWSRDRYWRSALYQDAYAAMSVEFQVVFSLADGPLAATIGFAANRSDRDFADGELVLLQTLRSSLRAAWQRAQASSALATTVGRVAGSPQAEALVLVDARCTLTVVTQAARRLGAAAGIDFEEGQPVPAALLRWLRHQAHRRPLVLVGEGSTVQLQVVAGAGDADRVISLVERVDDVSSVLTRRELEVAEALARGLTNAEIASDLGISARTVDKHLERAFTKLGVTNRTAAVGALRRRDPS